MPQKASNQGSIASLKSKLTKGTIGTFGLKLAAVGISFITSILLARLLGTKGYGVYSYINAWILLLQIPAGLGLRALLVREISAYQSRSEWSLMHGLLHWANQTVLMVSIAVGLLAAIVAWLLIADLNSQMLVVFCLGLGALPWYALNTLRQGAMQGLHHIVSGQLPETLIQPVLFLILVSVGYLIGKQEFDVNWVMGINVLTVGVAFFIGTQMLRRTLPEAVKNESFSYKIGSWLHSVLPFMLITCMYAINNRIDALMLGTMKGAEMVGIYVVASRGAELVQFILISFNTSLGPVVANLYARAKLEELQHIITKSSRVIFLVSFPVTVSIISFGQWFLLLFGSEFIQGYMALIILSLGQLVNATTGSVGLLLNMTGHERDTAIGVGFSAFLNIVLNAMLIPKWGIEGAATATTISTICWNIFLFVCVAKKLGIYTTPLGGKKLFKN
jgi:O-antigen/teichoic acid export membrane protein